MKIKRALLLSVFLFIIFVFAFWGKLFRTGYTPVIKDENGELINGSIASLERIMLGEMEQSILIRGHDKNNPILLWLHGGPGSSQMPIAHKYDKELEKEFVMVHWDQRGAGKSNKSNFNENTMTYDQFISDGHQLTKYLKDRFNKDKIYLLGHSWGTQLGLELVAKYSEDYYSYISVSQVINQKLHHEIGYLWLLEEIQEKGNEKDLEKLKYLGEPPFYKHDDFVIFIQLINAYGGSFDLPFSKLLWISLKSSEYTFKDYLAWLDGSNRGSGKMWNEDSYMSFNSIEKFPQLDLPVYFFIGKNDYNTPLEATKKYYQSLIAPAGKQIVIFEKSAHTPFLAEPDKFVKELIRVKKETYSF